MLMTPDMRYTADSATTAAAASVLFPIRIIARRPNSEQALTEARQIVEEFRLLAERSHAPGGRLTLADLAATFEKHSGRLTLAQRSKKEVQLELEFLAIVSFANTDDFWGRASTLAWAADQIQAFCVRSWPKGVWVMARRGRFVSEVAAHEESLVNPESMG